MLFGRVDVLQWYVLILDDRADSYCICTVASVGDSKLFSQKRP